MALLQSLPEFKKGDYVFSATFGPRSLWISNKIKKRVDHRMLRRRGDDPTEIKLPHWQNHDIRRVVTGQLSRLKITEEAREAVMAHSANDKHEYLDEKRESLELWAARNRRRRALVRRRPSRQGQSPIPRLTGRREGDN